jgi:threonine dehydratase
MAFGGVMKIEPLVVAAEARIRPHVRTTPVEKSAALSRLAGCDVRLKLENFQATGSFKIRGVLSKLLSLDRDDLSRGVITASTGNHGLATAHAAELLGIDAEVVLPEGANPWRLSALRASGVGLRFHGTECAEAEVWARAEAGRTGRVYLPPYSDPEVVAGQGTICLELLREPAKIDVLAAAVGGGGLISGVGGVLKERGWGTRVIGCVPENSPAMYDSVRAGRIVESQVRPTLSDSTAGNIEPGAITLDLCRTYVDDWALVAERDIRRVVRLVFEEHGMVIEGAAGVAIAGFLDAIDRLELNQDSTAVIIVCGGNVSPDYLDDILF